MLDTMFAAVVSAVLAFVVSIAVWLVQRRRKSLRYSVTESEPFPVQGGGVARFYTLDLWNTGTDSVSNASLGIEFGAEVESVRAEPAHLIPDLERAGRDIAGPIPLLNPQERLRITATLGDAEEATTPHVTVRADGVTAQPVVASTSGANAITSAVWLAFALGLGLMGYTIGGMAARTELRVAEMEARTADLDGSFESFQARTNQLEETLDGLDSARASARLALQEGEPTGQDRIFALLSQAGLARVQPLVISFVPDITYANTAYFLFYLYLADPDRGSEYLAGLEAIGAAENVAAASRGVAHYLLARIAEDEGRAADATTSFQALQTTAPRMFTHLMAQNRMFDVAAIEATAVALLGPQINSP